MKTKMKCMLAKKGKEEDIENPDYWMERKFDGTRVITVIKDNRPRMYGRSGNEYTERYPEIVEELKQFPDGKYDGELTFFEKDGTERFVTCLVRPETKAKMNYYYFLFDIIEDINSFNIRRQNLRKIFFKIEDKRYLRISKIVKKLEKKKEFFKKMLGMGAEGVILKHWRMFYQYDRSKYCLKIKNEETEDLVIRSWTEGTGRRLAYFGALEGYQIVNGEWKKVANVGGGFPDKDLEEIKEKYLLPDGKVKKEFVIEIKFLNRTNKFNYRMPSFIRVRNSKPINECVWGGE